MLTHRTTDVWKDLTLCSGQPKKQHHPPNSHAKDSNQVQNLKTSKSSDLSISDQQILHHPSNQLPLLVSAPAPFHYLCLPFFCHQLLSKVWLRLLNKKDSQLGRPLVSSAKPELPPSSTSHFLGPWQNHQFPMWLKRGGEQRTSELSINQQRNPSNLPDNLNLVCLP